MIGHYDGDYNISIPYEIADINLESSLKRLGEELALGNITYRDIDKLFPAVEQLEGYCKWCGKNPCERLGTSYGIEEDEP